MKKLLAFVFLMLALSAPSVSGAAEFPQILLAAVITPTSEINVLVTGMDVDKVICTANGATVLGVYNGGTGYWDCSTPFARGGEPAAVRVVGVADGAPVSLEVLNMNISSAMCRDKSSRQRSAAMIGGGTCDCGLAPDPGSKVVVRVTGTYAGDGGGDVELPVS